jgi:transposase
MVRETGRKRKTPARKDFVVRARERIGGEAVLAYMIEPLLELLGVMPRAFARLTKQVLGIVRDEPVRRRLMSAPGVGPLTIDQPERFRTSRDVGAHLGLTKRRYQSGATDVKGRVSRCGDVVRQAHHEGRARRSTIQPIHFWFAARSGRPCEHGA